MNKKFYFLITILFVFTQNIIAQSSSVFVNARAQKDKILVRWAVDSPIEWQNSNKNGFIIYKMLIKKDGKLLNEPSKEQLAILKPEPLEQWMDYIQKDQYAAIVAQALYGDSFEVGQESENELTRIINIADELNQRYSFALFAADLSFAAALKAGWGYIDTTVKKGEVYAYQVEAVELLNINPGAYMIGLEDYEELPKVNDFMAIPDDGQVILSWGIELLKNTYTSYMIERSVNGIDYHPISATPIVDLNSNADKNATQMFFGSKLEFNNKDYYFRIYGVNAFAEKGPYSEPIKTQGRASVVVAPRIVNYQIPNPNEVELEWEFPKEEEKNIKSFEVHLADNDNAEYKMVAKDISQNARKHNYKGLGASNYFKIAVVDKQDKKLFSQSTLVQPIDSIAPLKPTGLEGKIDSLGYVTLKWKPNTEKDLAGYRVLRANSEKEEFVDLFNKIITETTAKDSVSFAISNRKVYYRLVAEDMRYNGSEFSDVLVLEKPDKLPPTAPVFEDFETKDGKNILTWINSSSDDVDKHYLRRRLKGETQWIEIASFTNGETTFTDDKTEADQTYEYFIQANDKSGLWSNEEVSKLTITTLNNTPVSVLKNIESVADRNKKTLTIYWNYDSKYTISEIQIYKNIKGDKPSLWKVLDGKYQSITDKDLKMNTDYEYHFIPAVSPSKIVKGETIQLTF